MDEGLGRRDSVMTALVWTLTWILLVLPVMSSLPRPVKVTLTSKHFIHRLSWEPGPDTPPGTSYRVMVNTDTGPSWVPVSTCQDVRHPLVCNLTEAFSDPMPVYFAAVVAQLKARSSQPATSVGFQPIKDTHLDLPLLTVTSCGRDLCVDLRPRLQHLVDVYNTSEYQLRIQSSNHRAQFFRETRSLQRQILTDLLPGVSYCVSIRFSDKLFSRESNFSQPQCVSTLGSFPADAMIAAALCLLVVSGLVVVALLVYTGFICPKRRLMLPVLTSVHHCENILVVHSSPLSVLRIIKVTAPSSGEGVFDWLDESEGEGGTDSADVGYKLRVSSNVPCDSFSSSSSPCPSVTELGCLSPETISTFVPSDIFNLGQPSVPDQTRPADTQCLTADNEETPEENAQGHQEVDLLTLVLGRRVEEEEEEEEEEKVDVQSEDQQDTALILPSRSTDIRGGTDIETTSSSADEEEEEQCSYMRR